MNLLLICFSPNLFQDSWALQEFPIESLGGEMGIGECVDHSFGEDPQVKLKLMCINEAHKQ